MSQVMLGGENARQLYTKGDLVISLQYVNKEPAMVIFPRRKRESCKGAFIVLLSAAYKYTDQVYLLSQSFFAADLMGMFPDKATVFRIADTIYEGLGELCMMKPEPEKEKKVIGEGTLVIGGDKQTFELTDHVH